MNTEEEWLMENGFHYVDDEPKFGEEIEVVYQEESDYVSLDVMFRNDNLPSLDDWWEYCDGSWD